VISLQARAKLNLSLAVLAKRPDGFHEIESLMVPVTLHDTLTIRTSDYSDVRLTVRFGGRLLEPEAAVLRRDVPTDDSNLVVRAARLLAADAGETRGLEIDLVKEIPSGAGLGGGSSDAAAALVGAARAWGSSTRSATRHGRAPSVRALSTVAPLRRGLRLRNCTWVGVFLVHSRSGLVVLDYIVM
jgi:4-diphosphocytidyl-2-C-methyl-D-erythritol kinase